MISRVKKAIASLSIEDIALICSGAGIFIFDMLSSFVENSELAYAFSYMSFICFLVAIFLLVVFGIQDIRRNGFLKRKLLAPTAGVTLFLLVIAVNAYLYKLDSDMLDYVKGGGERLQAMAQCLHDTELSGEARERISKSYAETYYYTYGDIIEVEKEDGSTYPFDPYAEDSMGAAFWEKDRDEVFRNMIYFLLLLISSLLIAFFYPLKKKADSANE